MGPRQRAFLRVLLAAATATLAAATVNAATPFVVLHAFASGADGAQPYAALIQATDGNFYGTTTAGGALNRGTVFRMTPAGTVTVLHAFVGGADGDNPRAALIQANDGNFYGTTFFGGAFNRGTVFRMTPAGTITVLHAFAGGTDGANPAAALIQATDGNFYGTTSDGGLTQCALATACGTVFKMTAAGTITILHAFSDETDGGLVGAAIIQATDRNFYGTTRSGGAAGFGTVFKMTPDGTFTVLHAFTGTTDGANPAAALVQATDANFYGTTSGGLGTVFRMTLDGTVTSLHAFAAGADGASPLAALIQASDGDLYGTTAFGGALNLGTVFRMTLDGAVTILHAFAVTDGVAPFTALIQAIDENFYGTTIGPLPGGVVFRLALNQVTPKLVENDFDGDGTSDLAVFRPSNSTWYILQSQTSSLSAVPWGASGDIPVPGDYDGDGRTDLAVYRPSTGQWFILQSSTGTFSSVGWGTSGDLPVPADFDGDGRTDVAVYRPSTGQWFILQSSTGTPATVGWGTGDDRPVPADYDGDGRTDLAVYRPSTGQWFILQSSTGTSLTVGWGTSGDLPVPADFDGDGRTDLAVYRPSTGQWFMLPSSTGTLVTVQWGTSGDFPVPADFDGDGKADVAVYRHSTGTWIIFRSGTSTLSVVQWGDKTADDVPILEPH